MTTRRRDREWIWVPVLMGLGACWLGRWLGRDLVEGFWPGVKFLAGALRHGEWPAWNPYDRGGYAFAADPQAAAHYPLTWLAVLLGGGIWTVQLLSLLHVALAGTTLHAYLRTRGLPAVAAAAGGVLLMASMPWRVAQASTLCWPMAWAPLVWMATDRLVERAGQPGGWRRAAALGAALGLAASAGSPAGFFHVLLAGVLYGAWRLGVGLAGSGARRRVALPALAGLALAAAVTLALALIVVVPAFAVADDSVSWQTVRLHGGPGALHGGLPVGPALAGLVSPTVGWVNLYVGLIALALAVVGVGARWRADGGAPLLFAALAGLAVVVSFGAASPVLPWLVAHVPGFGLFEQPERYASVAALALAVLAAYGVAAFVDEEAGRRKRAAIVLGVAVAVLAAALLLLRVHAGMSYVALGLGGASLAAAAFVPARWRAALVAAAVGLVVLDVGWFSAPLVRLHDDVSAVDDEAADRRWLAGLDADVGGRWRVWDEFVLEQRAGSRLRIRDLRGRPEGDALDGIRFAQVRERVLRDPQLLGAYNVRWVLHGPHHSFGSTRNRLPEDPSVMRPELFHELDARRFELRAPAPLVLWYGAILLADHQRALDHVAMQESAPGARVLAVVEEKDVAADARAAVERLGRGELVRRPPRPVEGQLVAYEAERVVVRVDAPAEGIVVLNEAFAPGWRVRVDGAEATPVRVNYLLRGVVVAPGVHALVWTYEPRAGRAWRLSWAAGVAFVLAAGVSAWRSRTKQLDQRGERARDDE